LTLKTPAFAAVSSAVKLAERDPATRPYKALINAVLRGIDRDGTGPTDPVANFPDWLTARWRQTYGEAALQAMARAASLEPPTDLSLKPDTDAEVLAEALEARVLGPDTLRTDRRGDLRDWTGFEDGIWWVQDAAAAVPARLLEVRPDHAVLDLCAAPGGKTLQLAATGATVTALDRSDKRLDRLRDNLKRMGLSAEVIASPAEDWTDPRQFDRVLLDAPCSATGTFRRNPEALRATRPADIGNLADVQHRLLDAAAARVAPGGRLVYCTCSLESDEGEVQVDEALAR
ncbi:MAG TPA: rRNA methyltransferase, partial [Brevundimonas sp.]|nr:rRNA methyltransferase [Brevundimonas sp.]